MTKKYKVQATKKGSPSWFGNVDVWFYDYLVIALIRFVSMKISRSWVLMTK
jgi:hypothetical protein